MAIDDWKLSIFKRHLDAAGYTYKVHPGLSGGTLLLVVEYEWVAKLQPVCKAAQDECAGRKGAPCPTCKAKGFAPSRLGPHRCTFCDGTEGGNPP